MRKIVEQYNVSREKIFRGVRGRENEAREGGDASGEALLRSNVAGDSRIFRNQRLSTVSWNCRVIEFKMAKEMKIRLKRSQLAFT